VQGWANPSAALTGSSLWEAFGTRPASAGSLPGPFGYVGGLGYYLDQDLAMPLLSIRHYAPPRGLFVARDPVLSQPRYQYVAGLPTVGVDADGRKGEWKPPWWQEMLFLLQLQTLLGASNAACILFALRHARYDLYPDRSDKFQHCAALCYSAVACFSHFTIGECYWSEIMERWMNLVRGAHYGIDPADVAANSVGVGCSSWNPVPWRKSKAQIWSDCADCCEHRLPDAGLETR
jgi:hypothetical protein